jgi:Lon protease-like protein
MKGLDIVEAKRLEMDTSAVDMVKALMSIYRTTTDNGTVTYKARRTDTTGHADEAFALLHALSFEPLTGEKRKMTVRTSKARRERLQQQTMGLTGGNVALVYPTLHTNLDRTAANDDAYHIHRSA